MYLIKEILVRLNRTWSILDQTTDSIPYLLNKYHVILVTLGSSDNQLVTQYSLRDVHNIGAVDHSISIHAFFTSYTGALPAAIKPIKSLSNVKTVKYSSVWDSNLSANRGRYIPNQLQENLNYTPDIAITPTSKQVNSLQALSDKLLFLINGRVFFSTLTNHAIYLLNGYDYINQCKPQHIALLDFSALGGYQHIPLATHQLTLFSGTTENSVVNVTLDNIDMAGKTLLLVLDGQLHILDETYAYINSSTIQVRLNHERVIANHINDRNVIVNWCQPANLSGQGFNPKSVDAVTYLNNTGHLLLIDTDELCINTVPLLRTGMPGRFSFKDIPNGIMLYENGEIGDYSITSATSYGVELSTSLLVNGKRLADTVPEDKLLGINNANLITPDYTGAAIMVNLYTL